MRTERDPGPSTDTRPVSITELVWDTNDSGTATSRRGGSLSVGGESGWLPIELLALAVEANFMTVFMARAEAGGIEVLGYASAIEAAPGSPDAPLPMFTARICVIVAAPATPRQVNTELEQTLLEAGICASLGERLTVSADIFVSPPDAGG